MEHPLSRTFINAFVDGFELKNTIKDVRGFFRKKRRNFDMKLNESLPFWVGGRYNSNKRKSLTALIHCYLVLGHYSLELYHEQRYKIRWTEPRSQIVQIETETSPQISSPQPHAKMPWSGKRIASTFNQSSVEMTTQQMNELRLEGERVVLIPLAPLERFFSGCLPYAPDKKGDWFNNQSTWLGSIREYFEDHYSYDCRNVPFQRTTRLHHRSVKLGCLHRALPSRTGLGFDRNQEVQFFNIRI